MPTPNTEAKQTKAFTARFPEILYSRISDAVARNKKSGIKPSSIQDWIIEACREKLDGIVRDLSAVANRAADATDIAASIPGVRLGIPEHTVMVIEDMPPVREFLLSLPDKDDAPPFDPTPTEPTEEQLARLEFGDKLIDRGARELPWWRKATWAQRLERLREMRDSAGG